MIAHLNIDPLVERSRRVEGNGIMRWSDQPPSGEGFYWYRNSHHGVRDIVRVYSRPGSDVLRATGAFYEQHVVDTMDGEWAGPIPYPAP